MSNVYLDVIEMQNSQVKIKEHVVSLSLDKDRYAERKCLTAFQHDLLRNFPGALMYVGRIAQYRKLDATLDYLKKKNSIDSAETGTKIEKLINTCQSGINDFHSSDISTPSCFDWWKIFWYIVVCIISHPTKVISVFRETKDLATRFQGGVSECMSAGYLMNLIEATTGKVETRREFCCHLNRYLFPEVRNRLENSFVCQVSENVKSIDILVMFGMSMSIILIVQKLLERCQSLQCIKIVVSMKPSEYKIWKSLANKNLEAFQEMEESGYNLMIHKKRIHQILEYSEILNSLSSQCSVELIITESGNFETVNEETAIVALDPGLEFWEQKNARKQVADLMRSRSTEIVKRPFVYADDGIVQHAVEYMTTRSDVLQTLIM